jgi:hypothetical protein
LGIQPKLGNRFYLKLNLKKKKKIKIIVWKPIVKKYSDGKVKRTLKKGLKVFEIVKRERHKIIKNRFFTLFHSILILYILFFIFVFLTKKMKNFKKNIKILMYLKKMTYYQYGIKMEENFFFLKII